MREEREDEATPESETAKETEENQQRTNNYGYQCW